MAYRVFFLRFLPGPGSWAQAAARASGQTGARASPMLPVFEDHARRFLNHTDLDGIHWINITREVVRLTTIGKH